MSREDKREREIEREREGGEWMSGRSGVGEVTNKQASWQVGLGAVKREEGR
jgi:hypothetical protein